MPVVNDLMTKKVITVHPETSLIKAAGILAENNLNGLPVVDKENVLVGIVTDYDLIIKGSSLHLPTFIKLFTQLDLYKKDQGLIKDELKKILEIKVDNVMNREPLVLMDNASIEEAFKAFSEHHRVNPIPIIDSEKKLMGVLSRYDLNKLFRSSGLFLKDDSKERDIDKNINLFIKNFDKQFVFVSKSRTHLWVITSLACAVIGYIIAWALILKITS